MTDSTKRIPKSIGTDTKAFGEYTLADLAVGVFPAVLVVVATRALVPSGATVAGVAVASAALPLAGVALAGGALVVYLTPRYASSLELLATAVGYLTASRRLTHGEARVQPQVREVHPEHDALERTDGAVVGLVEVDTLALGLPTSADWEQRARQFEDFLDTTVEFPLQLYATTEPFDSDAYLRHYEERLSDSDVAANPQLQRLIEAHVDWYRSEMDRRELTIRNHYVVVAVTPAEIRFEDDGVVQSLAALPVVGRLLGAVVGPPRVEQRARMFETLDDRVRRVERGLRDLDDCRAWRLSAADAVAVIRDFWMRTPADESPGDPPFRTRPVVGGARDG